MGTMRPEIPAEWICAVSRFRLRWTGPDEVVAASANWIAEAPASDGLLSLASASVSNELRSEDIDAWIDGAMADFGWGVTDDETYFWIAVVSALASSPPPSPEHIARLLSQLARASDADFSLLSEFVALDDYVDEGIPRERVVSRIAIAYDEVRSELVRRLRDRLHDPIYGSLSELWARLTPTQMSSGTSRRIAH